jgi:hypothetical protein
VTLFAAGLLALGVSVATGVAAFAESRSATGKCLAGDSGGHVYALSCNGGSAQLWYIANAEPTTIVNAMTGLCLDSAEISGSSDCK